MKKIFISLLFSPICMLGYAQNTNFGSNAGYAGTHNSAFGYYALDNVKGSYNTASGSYALFGNTDGDKNSAHGYRSLYRNQTGSYNVAMGSNSMLNNTSGSFNTGIGTWALLSNTSGTNNTAVGMGAMYSNTSGKENTASGFQSLDKNTTGSWNAAFGYQALNANIAAWGNTAIGYQALLENTHGSTNSAVGRWALKENTIGNYNTANGGESMAKNTSGNNNVAMGYKSLSENKEGNENASFGYFSMASNTTGEDNTAVGSHSMSSNTVGFCNTAVGAGAGPSGANFSNSMALGCGTMVTASNAVRVGNTSITSIGGEVGWSTLSDGRFKKEIKEDIPGLEFITQLRPVSYTVDKQELNNYVGTSCKSCKEDGTSAIRESGFIAQEVEQIVKESGYTFNGVDEIQNEKDVYGIRYAMFVVPLVKSVQELNKKVNEQEATIQQLLQALTSQQEATKGTLQETNETSVSIEEKSELQEAYPNPVEGVATFQMHLNPTVENAKIVVFSMDGKELNSYSIGSRGQVSILQSLEHLPAGTYLYSLITDNEVIATKQLILSK